jgi:hypothetical protein
VKGPGRVLPREPQAAHTLPPAELGRAFGQAMAGLGATATCLFLVDHDHVRVHPLGPDADELKPPDIDTTVAGRAFAWERTHTAKTDGGVRLWVPMIDGTPLSASWRSTCRPTPSTTWWRRSRIWRGWRPCWS